MANRKTKKSMEQQKANQQQKVVPISSIMKMVSKLLSLHNRMSANKKISEDDKEMLRIFYITIAPANKYLGEITEKDIKEHFQATSSISAAILSDKAFITKENSNIFREGLKNICISTQKRLSDIIDKSTASFDDVLSEFWASYIDTIMQNKSFATLVKKIEESTLLKAERELDNVDNSIKRDLIKLTILYTFIAPIPAYIDSMLSDLEYENDGLVIFSDDTQQTEPTEETDSDNNDDAVTDEQNIDVQQTEPEPNAISSDTQQTDSDNNDDAVTDEQNIDVQQTEPEPNAISSDTQQTEPTEETDSDDKTKLKEIVKKIGEVFDKYSLEYDITDLNEKSFLKITISCDINENYFINQSIKFKGYNLIKSIKHPRIKIKLNENYMYIICTSLFYDSTFKERIINISDAQKKVSKYVSTYIDYLSMNLDSENAQEVLKWLSLSFYKEILKRQIERKIKGINSKNSIRNLQNKCDKLLKEKPLNNKENFFELSFKPLEHEVYMLSQAHETKIDEFDDYQKIFRGFKYDTLSFEIYLYEINQAQTGIRTKFGIKVVGKNKIAFITEFTKMLDMVEFLNQFINKIEDSKPDNNSESITNNSQTDSDDDRNEPIDHNLVIKDLFVENICKNLGLDENSEDIISIGDVIYSALSQLNSSNTDKETPKSKPVIHKIQTTDNDKYNNAHEILKALEEEINKIDGCKVMISDTESIIKNIIKVQDIFINLFNTSEIFRKNQDEEIKSLMNLDFKGLFDKKTSAKKVGQAIANDFTKRYTFKEVKDSLLIRHCEYLMKVFEDVSQEGTFDLF